MKTEYEVREWAMLGHNDSHRMFSEIPWLLSFYTATYAVKFIPDIDIHTQIVYSVT